MINYVPFHEIETKRMILRKQKEDDLYEYHQKIASNPNIAKYMLWEACDDLELTKKHMKAWIKAYGTTPFYRYVLEHKENHAILGTIQLVRFCEEDMSCEFAYLLVEQEWNQGYMTEALLAVFSFAFFELHLKKIRGDHYIQNKASGMVMKKAGMHYVGDCKDVYQMKESLDTLSCYEITKDEFKEQIRTLF